MSLKMKLTSTIAAFLLILGLTIMGVMAAPSATVNLGGSISFSASDVYAKVTGEISGQANEVSLEPLNFNNETDVEEEGAKWSNKDLVFDNAGSEITITVTIENLAKDRPLYASISDKFETIENITKGMTQLVSVVNDTESEYEGHLIELPASTGDGTSTAIIEISLEVTNKNASLADGLKWGYDIQLDNEDPIKTVEQWRTKTDGTALDFTITNGEASVKSCYIEGKADSGMPTVEWKTNGDVVIPAYVRDENGDACPVTSIAANANTAYWYRNTGLKSIEIPATVVNIGENAFDGCSGLTDVIIDKCPTTMGANVFTGCSKLENVTINNGAVPYSMFSGLSSIKTLTLGDSVTAIGDFAFQNCSGLTSITIPDSMTDIGKYAFSGCSGLTEIDLSNVTSIRSWAFSGCSGLEELKIPAGVETIGGCAFSGCSGVTSVVVDEENDNYTDGDCNAIIGKTTNTLIQGFNCTTTIPNNVTTIGSSAFQGCSGLTEIDLSNVTSIEYSAFQGCSELATITLGTGISSISAQIFNSCNKISTINYLGTKAQWETLFANIGDNNGSIKTATVNYVNEEDEETIYTITEWANKTDGTALKFTDIDGKPNEKAVKASGAASKTYGIVTIPSKVKDDQGNEYTVTTITDDGFAGYDITKIVIGKNISSIGGDVFATCYDLESIEVDAGNTVYTDGDCDAIIHVDSNKMLYGCKNTTIPGYVTGIGDSAFYGCDIEMIDLKNVTTLEDYAFSDCIYLTEITFSAALTSIGENAFENCESLTTVNYGGTIAQWNALAASLAGTNNDALLNATINCSDGTINN